MNGTYWLGVLTVPAVAGAGWLLYHAGRYINRTGERIFAQIPLGNPDEQAGFAAFGASSRRAKVFAFGGIGVAVMLGFKPNKTEEVYRAVRKVIASPVAPARINPKWLRRAKIAEPKANPDATATEETSP